MDYGTQTYASWRMLSKTTQTGMDVSHVYPDQRLTTISPRPWMEVPGEVNGDGKGTQYNVKMVNRRTQVPRSGNSSVGTYKKGHHTRCEEKGAKKGCRFKCGNGSNFQTTAPRDEDGARRC
ncbi:hypothetical protein KPH14_007646 [Odynerus spinipes]|uniref:Uncharacterized protein n=1 Tax=Odynerus spinipes TaxID=1348599 RepID=A0AAD9RJ00_9HYME|nr:hypothetical protein KPH14_007646 [Odynerus spinipes]